ncbi:hypothetical protein [Oscillatoria sp. HE19RPO]|uniref:hypothetical protein n=1 Tax=Oscillatoria sp. HE19RPO TaxID=2954806 RepID=UPI0020C1D7E1|nr:hypothetical protein [Oscillatoria sp. HE19RPO]
MLKIVDKKLAIASRMFVVTPLGMRLKGINQGVTTNIARGHTHSVRCVSKHLDKTDRLFI